MDAIKFHMGELIIQDSEPIAFHSRKLPVPQQQYTVTEK